jgi:hypothetical protein
MAEERADCNREMAGFSAAFLCRLPQVSSLPHIGSRGLCCGGL